MSDKDLKLSKLELLKMARELVINEYIDRRAQDHNKWIAEADVAWRTQGIKLPYPAFPIYPSETEIIARANKLNEFLNKETDSVVKGTEEKISTEPTTQKIDVEPTTVSTSAVPEPIETNTISTVDTATKPNSNVYVAIQNTTTNSNLLSSFDKSLNEAVEAKTNSILSKFDQLKATWGIK